MLKSTTSFLATLFLCSVVLAQTPGGVNTPTEVRYWFESGELSSTADNMPISTWNNAGGNTDDWTQSNASNRPTLKNNGTVNQNGYPVIRFDGNNDEFNISNDNDINQGVRNTLSIVTAFRTSSDTSSTQLLYEQGGGNTRNFYLFGKRASLCCCLE